VKKIAILPTLLTLGNGVCGFSAIAVASMIDADPGYLVVSAWLVIAAMIFDVFDGYVARLSRTASEFGGQLDSLCDAVSFGAAPAFILWKGFGGLYEAPVMRQTVAVVAVLYMVCAILRLARFNVENTPDPAGHKRFKGLPSPVAAGCVVSLAILRGQMPTTLTGLEPALKVFTQLWAPVGALLVAMLMVSRVPFPHLTKQLLRGRRHFSYLVRIVLVVALIALMRELAVAVVFWGYTLGLLVNHGIARALHHDTEPAPAAGLDDAVPH